jgi:hypothetical protein
MSDAPPTQRSKVSRAGLVELGAWAGVAVITVVLVQQRYVAAIADGGGTDLAIFLRGADHASSGNDVYDEPAYTYSPLLAWILVPIAGNAFAVEIWTAFCLACGLAAIALVVLTLRDRLPGWRAPVVAGVGVVTLYFSHVATIELFLGQVQFPLLALAAAAVFVGRRRPIVSGILLAVAALLKTWPAMLLLWLARRGQPGRWWGFAGAAATGALFLVAWWAIGGFDGPGRLVERTLHLREQRMGLYSVWYFAREGVPGADDPLAMADAPILGQVTSWVLAAAVVAGIVLVLRRPGDPSLAMWNLAGATILLLPDSHPFYRVLLLPALWVWLAIVLSSRRRREPLIVVAVLAAWWIVAFRNEIWQDGWVQFAEVAMTVLAFGTSVIFAARLPQDAARSGGPHQVVARTQPS